MELHMVAKHDSVDDVEVVFKRGVSSTTRGDDDLHDDHGQKLDKNCGNECTYSRRWRTFARKRESASARGATHARRGDGRERGEDTTVTQGRAPRLHTNNLARADHLLVELTSKFGSTLFTSCASLSDCYIGAAQSDLHMHEDRDIVVDGNSGKTR